MRRSPDGDYVGDVKSLLSSYKKKILVSGNGDEVPFSFLEGKVVGFYFYTRPLECLEMIRLSAMCQDLKDSGKNFELVFVCLDLVLGNRGMLLRKTFRKRFKRKKHLLELPFSERKCNKKLYELFSRHTDPYEVPELVVIQPGENIAHTYAMPIFERYGIGAYPFSKSRVTEIEVAKLKSLTLDEVLFSGAGAEKFVYDQDGQKIPASHLKGKKVILFFTTTQISADVEACQDEKVIAWYNEIKHKDESFEMIRVLYNYHLLREEVPRKVPWLEFPHDECRQMDILGLRILPVARWYEYYYSFLPMFVTFGQDGQFITMTMTRLGRLMGSGKAEICPDFFNDAHLNGEVRDYIAECNRWTTVNEETGECYIPP